MLSWARLLEKWALIEADFHSEYGVDLSSRRLRRRKSWRWFAVRVRGLLLADTRLWRELKPEGEPDGGRGSYDSWVDQREADA